MYAFVSIFHHDETLFHSFVKPTIFWTLFLSFSLLCFVRIFNVIRTGVVCLDV